MGLLMDAPLGVCEIARRLGSTYYNVSKHLRILREAGLLESKNMAGTPVCRTGKNPAQPCTRPRAGSWLLQIPVRSMTVTRLMRVSENLCTQKF